MSSQNIPDNNLKKNIDGSKRTDLSEEEILSLFTETQISQINVFVYKSIELITEQVSCFKMKKVVDKVLDFANKDPKLSMHEYIEDLVVVICSRVDFVEIGDSGFLTTHDIQELEHSMVSLAGELTQDHVLDSVIVENAIAEKKGISEEQQEAVYAGTFSEKFVTAIEGMAGAGKSFTMAAIKKSYIDSGYHVMGTALSWNAAFVLGASTGLSDCEALQGLLNKIERASKNGTEYFRKPTLLIVDEAGLIGTKHMAKLLKACYEAKEKVKVVLTGDTLQLSPVNAGSALEVLVCFHGTTRIDTIRRQRQDSHKIAVKKFSQRRSGEALYTFKHQESLHWSEDKEAQYNIVVRDFLSYKYNYPNKKPLILALSNQDVSELNKRVRAAYKKLGLVHGLEVNLSVTDGKEVWKSSFSVGDEVVVRANSKDILVYEIPNNKKDLNEDNWIQKRVGVFNRNTGTIVGVKPSKVVQGSFDLIIDMGGDLEGRIMLNTKKFRHQEKPAFPVVHNFATTIYASQGQTVSKVFIIDSPLIEFRLAYVGMSRHTDGVEIYLNESELHTRLDIAMGKAKPTRVKKQDMNSKYNSKNMELPVILGRYTKREMLSAVSNSWGKDSKNETATVFSRRMKTEVPDKNKDENEKEMFKIKYAGNNEPIVDFDSNRIKVQADETWEQLAIRCKVDTENAEIFQKWLVDIKSFNNLSDSFTLEGGDVLFLSERLNVKYPLIDLQKLLDLPDPIYETITISDSEVEENNHNEKDLTEIPLKDKEGFNSGKIAAKTRKIYDTFIDDIEDMKVKSNTKQDEKDMLLQALGHSLFERREAKRSEIIPEARELDKEESLPGKVKDFLKKNLGMVDNIEIPYIEDDNINIGFINRKGLLEFTGEHGLTNDFLEKSKGIYWGEGKNYEPRIFAMTRNSEIAARYKLDGTCVTGEGYPPMLLNPDSTENTPIMLMANPKEWLWTYEYKMTQVVPNDKIEFIPHLIWAAKDIDWGFIAKRLEDKTVLIARGNDDNKERSQWSVELQEKLWNKFKVKAMIRPEIPGRVNPWNLVNENILGRPKI